jgi:hypothetical protein
VWWLHKQRAWWVVVFNNLVIFLLLCSCAAVPSSRKYVGIPSNPKGSVQPEDSFPSMWEKWTVQIGAVGGGAPLQLINPLTMIGGGDRGGKDSQFPLQIAATLMDSLLIEAGLQHYANLAKMTPEEKTSFRNAYFQRYDVENHLLIWCELQTTFTELYLDPNRWIMFIQDDAGNQYEPLRILDGDSSFSRTVADRFPQFQPEQKELRWKVHQKNLMLCFPKKDFLKKPILSGEVRFLKLVFQLSEDEKTRAEGMWVFKQ